MSDDRIEKPQEIVIVRRRGGDDAAAVKGGAWKIAYADFVTAMMAFFLVMWLINASNEETRAQVASYFNPIKLTDSSTGARGLKDSKESKAAQKGGGEVTAGGSPPSAPDAKREAELLANPDKLLAALEAKVAATPPPEVKSGAGMDGNSELAGAGGSASGATDPFDPRSWESVPPDSPRDPPAAVAKEDDKPTRTDAGNAVQTTPQTEAHVEAKNGLHGSKSELPVPQLVTADAGKQAAEAAVAAGIPDQIPEDKEKPEKKPEAPTASSSTGKTIRQSEAVAIAAELAAKLGTGLDDLEASIDIKKTDEGTLISLTDKQSFGMFQSGSAEPQPEMVRLVEAIAGVLAARQGFIVVRGHTDSKPYRNKKYDNWQLSTARAHLAQYMLVRGGVDASRIRRIEGLADRHPRNPGDPQAPENRRIEILLGHDKL